MEPAITKEELDKLTGTMGELVSASNNSNELADTIVKLLSLPDEEFSILAPGILQSYQQSLNNPNDKIMLVQTLNASGIKAEDFTASFLNIEEEIDKMTIPRIKRDFLKELIGSLVNAINDTEGISKRNVQVAIELCHEDAKVPQYAHITDSGADVFAIEDITIHPGQTVLVPTGIKIAPPPGYEVQIRAKSGRALKTKMRLCNAIGTVDQGYRDEIKVIIENVEPPIKDITIDDEGKVTSIEYGKDYFICKGEKFCQLVLMEVPKASFYRVGSVMELGENRNGGFGSTGLK